MLTTPEGNRLDGCIFNAGAPTDSRMDFADDPNPPRKIDLRDRCTPVEDQGRIGSCTANAAVGALEYLYMKRDGHAPDLSRLFVYFNTRRLRGTIQQDTGAQINEAMAAVMAFGACEARHWPYDPSRFTEQPPEQAYLDGRKYEAINYARVAGPAGCIPALVAGIPVVYGTFMPQRCYQEASSTGRVPKTTPEERSGKPGGGHCMLIVGYDLDAQTFLVRNSWGMSWGTQGYVEIPFEEMIYWSPPETFWCAVEMEKTGGQAYSLVAAAPSLSVLPPASTEGSVLGTTVSDLRANLSAELRGDLDQKKDEIMGRMGRIRDSLDASDAAQQTPGSDGSTVPCNPCAGSGKCFNCKGTGAVLGAMCMACRGSSTCDICRGSGTVEKAAAMLLRPTFGDTQCFSCNGTGYCYFCDASTRGRGDPGCNKCLGNGRCNSCSGLGYT